MKKLIYLLISLSLFSVLFGCSGPTDPILVSEEAEEDVFSGFDNRYFIEAIPGATTVLSLEWPVLHYNAVDFNLETMTPGVNGMTVMTEYNQTERLIYIKLGYPTKCADFIASSTLNDISETQFIKFMADFYSIPDPVEDYSHILYSLTGYITGGTPDSLVVTDTDIIINGMVQSEAGMSYVISNDAKVYQLSILIEVPDSQYWNGDNLYNWFGIDYSRLTYDDLIMLADIIERTPNENWLQIQESYGL